MPPSLCWAAPSPTDPRRKPLPRTDASTFVPSQGAAWVRTGFPPPLRKTIMAKIKLGNRPKNFKRIVTFDMLEGGKGSIECTFKYRTRSEFGVFIDKLIEAAGAKEKPEGDKFSMAELMEKTAGQNAEYLLDVLESWNLDEDLNKPNAQQLADELPAAAAAIMETYRTAVTEGRLGN